MNAAENETWIEYIKLRLNTGAAGDTEVRALIHALRPLRTHQSAQFWARHTQHTRHWAHTPRSSPTKAMTTSSNIRSRIKSYNYAIVFSRTCSWQLFEALQSDQMQGERLRYDKCNFRFLSIPPTVDPKAGGGASKQPTQLSLWARQSLTQQNWVRRIDWVSIAALNIHHSFIPPYMELPRAIQ